MAPEIHKHHPYEGAAVDLFASAVILVIMRCWNPPFEIAVKYDPSYNIMCGNPDRYWKLYERNFKQDNPNDNLSKEFTDLLKRML